MKIACWKRDDLTDCSHLALACPQTQDLQLGAPGALSAPPAQSALPER